MTTGTPPPENETGTGQILSGTTPLNEIQIQALPDIPRSQMPVIEALATAVGLSLLLAGYFKSEPNLLMQQIGGALLTVALLVLVMELIIERVKAIGYLRKVRPMIGELEKLRDAIGEYLVDMDKRTSRYFHCVTNTKVTTYFMLRQLDGSLEELLDDLRGRARGSSPSAYTYVRERLRGSIEFRDGFEFSKGKVFHVPVGKLPATVHRLMTELELGVKTLEEEIKSLSDKIHHPDYGPPERESASKNKKKPFDRDLP